MKWRKEARANAVETYGILLNDHVGFFDPLTVGDGSFHARHLMPIHVPAEHRDPLIAHLASRGIEASVHYRSLTELTYFRRIAPAHCPIAEQIGSETLSLPLWPGMPIEAIEGVCEAVREYFG